VPRLVAVPVLAVFASHAAGARATVPVHFASEESGVTVYSRPVLDERLAGSDGAGDPPEFERLCEASCDAALAPTTHEFALAREGSAPIPATPAFELKGDTRFRGDVISHQSTRTAGWWILGILGTAGATSTTIGLLQTCVDDQTCQEWTSLAIWSGIAAMTAGVLIGVPKIVVSDEATLTLVPGTAPLPPAGARMPADRTSPIATGATITAHF
jgi:hypothetical protein